MFQREKHKDRCPSVSHSVYRDTEIYNFCFEFGGQVVGNLRKCTMLWKMCEMLVHCILHLESVIRLANLETNRFFEMRSVCMCEQFLP